MAEAFFQPRKHIKHWEEQLWEGTSILEGRLGVFLATGRAEAAVGWHLVCLCSCLRAVVRHFCLFC